MEACVKMVTVQHKKVTGLKNKWKLRKLTGLDYPVM